MSIGHKGMLYAGKVLAAATVEFMQKPELVERARQDFRVVLYGFRQAGYDESSGRNLTPQLG